jgi:putative ABC transport system substrate-binding protein
MRDRTRVRSSSFRSDNRESKTCTALSRRIENLKLVGTFAIALTFVFGGAAAQAQLAKRIPRIGFLSVRAGVESREEAFRHGLRELGYIEGQNLIVEWRFAKGQANRLPELASELVQLKLDVIVTAGTEATQAAKNATGAIPVVQTGTSDPVGSGFIASLSRPGGSLTGLSLDAPGLGGKRLEILKESFPKVSRIAVLYGRASPSSKVIMAETEQAAQALKVQLQPLGVEAAKELESAFSAMTRERAEALVKLPSALLTSFRKQIVELATKSRLPAMYEDRIIVEDGGLMSYGPDITDLYRRSTMFVDKILKGAKPGDLPVEQPTKFEFIINLKAAKQIGLTIPPNVLARADKVIK